MPLSVRENGFDSLKTLHLVTGPHPTPIPPVIAFPCS